MHWRERDMETRQDSIVGGVRAAELEAAKDEKLPTILKESTGVRPFDQMKFQPVRAHGLFDAEFAYKGEDIIFHFWPYDFHQAQRKGTREPKFPADFEPKLRQAMKKSFAENRIVIERDPDVGAFFVKALSYAVAFSPFTLATDACKELYQLLGGS